MDSTTSWNLSGGTTNGGDGGENGDENHHVQLCLDVRSVMSAPHGRLRVQFSDKLHAYEIMSSVQGYISRDGEGSNGADGSIGCKVVSAPLAPRYKHLETFYLSEGVGPYLSIEKQIGHKGGL